MPSIYTNYVNGKRLRVDYSSTQNSDSNYSVVTLRAYKELISGIDGAPGDVYKARLTIDGVSLNISAGVPIITESVTYLGQYSRTIYHNSDGKKSIYIQGYFETINAYTNNTLYNLPTILKAANFTSLYVANTTLNSATIVWDADSTVGYADYNINGGSPIWASGATFTIPDLAPGTTYTITVNIQRLDSGLWTSKNIQVTTKDIAKVTNANNINDEQNPYMTFSNPGGAELLAYIEILNPFKTVCTRDNITNTGNYTFILTQVEKDIIYENCKNKNFATLRYGIATKINGEQKYWNWMDKTISIVNANPIFNNFTYEDTNTVTKVLTGNNQKVIKGYSNIKATVTVANKAVAQKGAVMSKYTFVTGTRAGVDGLYLEDANAYMKINNADGNVASVYAIDSRNNSTKKDIPVQLIEYAPINIKNISAVRGTGGIGTQVTLNFDGDIWNNNFSAVQNTIVSAKYRYNKTTDSEWTEGTTNIMPILNGNSYSKSVNIAGDLGANGFDNAFSYNIEIEIKDELSTSILKTVLQSGKPQLAFGIGEGVSAGGFYNSDVGGPFQIEGKRALSTDDIINNLTETSETKALSVNMGKYLNEKFTKHILSARNSAVQTITTSASWVSTKINIDANNSTGNKLTLNTTSKRIIIGPGVNKVLVSAAIYVGNNVSTLFGPDITKNGTTVARGYASVGGGWGATAAIPPKLIDVNQGDYLELFCYFDQAQTGKNIVAGNAIITVEVVE